MYYNDSLIKFTTFAINEARARIFGGSFVLNANIKPTTSLVSNCLVEIFVFTPMLPHFHYDSLLTHGGYFSIRKCHNIQKYFFIKNFFILCFHYVFRYPKMFLNNVTIRDKKRISIMIITEILATSFFLYTLGHI